MKTLFAVLVVSLVFMAGCSNSYDNIAESKQITLPPISESGQGTFGFMLDNSVWTVFGASEGRVGWGKKIWFDNELHLTYDRTGTPGENPVQLQGRMTIVQKGMVLKDVEALLTFLPAPPYVQHYILSGESSSTFIIEHHTLRKTYYITDRYPFELEITAFDLGTKICSGRFSGVVYNGADSLIVDDGRFDVLLR
jgi:hypothetical protein